MKWIILASLLLAACAHADSSMTGTSVPVTPAAHGAGVAEQLTLSYLDTRQNCGKPSTPAFLCSGVLLRGTNQSASHHAWNPRPGDPGVSFSYLRKDANFDHIFVGRINGFIFYPYFNAPPGKVHPQILCSFPIDANTWQRDGCGASLLYPNDSGPCQPQGITTAAQWTAHMAKGPSGADLNKLHDYICGFDVRDVLNEQAGPAFYQSLLAMHELPKALVHKYNELLIQTWAQDIPTTLPIQAFFYLPGGLARAQHDQEDFYNSTGGTIVPIIQMTLPAVVTDSALFQYNSDDQKY